MFYRGTLLPSCRRAFTLIELLVVIGVIAILAGIMFPVFAQVRDTARRAACQSNLKQLGLAWQMYVSDYDDKLPTMSGYTGTRVCANNLSGGSGSTLCTNDGFLSFFGWARIIQPYVKSTQILACPSFPSATFKWNGWLYQGCFAPKWPPRDEFPRGISYEYKGALATSGRVGRGLADIRALPKTVLFQEISPSHHFNMLQCGGADGIQCFNNPNNPTLLQKREQMGVNICFVDGHVRFCRVSETLFAKYNSDRNRITWDTYWVQNKTGETAEYACYASDGEDFE